ncbi:MAG: AsmA-like C-terminal region-containing protein [Bacteroidia bacterium]
MIKKFLQILTGLALGILGGIAVLVGFIYLNRDRLLQWAMTELRRQFAAELTFRQIRLSGLRTFPHLALEVVDLSLRTARGESLFSATKAFLYLNFWEALIEERYRIWALRLEGPTLWIRYDKYGRTPWSRLLTSTDDSAKTSWVLERIEVKGGRLIYEDKALHIRALVRIRAMEAYWAYRAGPWEVMGQAVGEIQSFSYKGTPWLTQKPFTLRGPLVYDRGWLLTQRLEGQLGGLKADLEGGIQIEADPPRVSLRLREVTLAWDELQAWWPQQPPELQDIPLQLTVAGEIVGLAGKGRLPRFKLKGEALLRESFTIMDYNIEQLYVSGGIKWDFDYPASSQLEIDSLWLVGGTGDTLRAQGVYAFAQAQGQATLRGSVHLEGLRAWSVPYADSLAGQLQADLHCTYTKGKWQVKGQGLLTEARFPQLHVAKARFSLSPDRLSVYEATLRYANLTLHVPHLSLYPYSAFQDSTYKGPVEVEGRVHCPFLPLDTLVASGGSSDTASPLARFQGHLHLTVDTLRWRQNLYGPAEIVVEKDSAAWRFRQFSLQGVGRGRLQGQAAYQPESWEIAGTFQGIQLEALHAELPELDTLFPLLPHLQGRASGELEGFIPLHQGAPRWSSARAQLTLRLEDFVVVESPYTYELFALVPLTDFRRIVVGEVTARLSLAEGVMRLDTTWLQANRWRMRVAGAHTLRGEIAYDLLVEVPRLLLDKSMARVKDLVEETEGDRVRLAIYVGGTTQQPRFRGRLASRTTPSSTSPAKPTQRKASRELPVQEE